MLFRCINIGGYARCILSYKEIEDELNSLYLYLHLFYNNLTVSDKIVGDFLRLFLRLFSSNFQRSFTTRKPVSAKFYDDFFSSSQNRFGRRFYVLLLLHHAGWHPPPTCANFHKD